MHDLGFFRANFDRIAERLATRGNVTGLDQFRELDQRRRAVITEAEELKARRNAESAEIAKLRKTGTDTTERQQQVREIGSRITALDEQIKGLDDQFGELVAGIPNLPHESVSKCAAPVSQGSSISHRKRTGTWGRSWAFWISSAPPRLRAHASPFIGAWAQSSSAR
jgi:seryl-tRNA synthetase